jgi:5'-methylthioinosine phosphorylase
MYAIIGGTGLNSLSGLVGIEQHTIDTPYGLPSGAISTGIYHQQKVCFLARHGQPHSIPPHKINYRANMHALKQLGVTDVIAINAVGGIHSHMPPKALSVPDQIIDYTWGREHTFYDGTNGELGHIDFTEPYTQTIRKGLIQAARLADIEILPCGVYAATNGPRLESAAEVMRIKQDGGDMIGMTGMPEASLAIELELKYACLALSVNWAAGLHGLSPITMEEIKASLESGIQSIEKVLATYLSQTTDKQC